MNKQRVWKIIGTVVVWLCIVAFFVGAAMLRHANESERRVQRLKVEVVDSGRLGLVTADKVIEAIRNEGLLPLGKRVDSVSLRAINNLVESNCFVHSAQTFVDYDGTVTIRLSQRKPIVRVITSRGEDFCLTAGAHLLPTQQGVALDLPLVTGDIQVPFPAGFRGDMQAWASANKKNTDKNYIFLLKLTNFVRLLESKPKLSENIVQIVVENEAKKGTSKEPKQTISLIPRKGNYSVQLGSLDNIEAKLDRWVRFVEAGVVDLNSEGTLNVSYEGQAVWKPQPKKSKK